MDDNMKDYAKFILYHLRENSRVKLLCMELVWSYRCNWPTWMKFDIDASYHQPWNHPQGWTYNYVCVMTCCQHEILTIWIRFANVDATYKQEWSCVDGITSSTYIMECNKMDEKIFYMDEIEPHEWRQSPMDENWQRDKYDIEGLDKNKWN